MVEAGEGVALIDKNDAKRTLLEEVEAEKEALKAECLARKISREGDRGIQPGGDNVETDSYGRNLNEVSPNPGLRPGFGASEASLVTEGIPKEVGSSSPPEAEVHTLDSFHRRGRKKVWDPEKAWRVLERIAQGETLKQICKKRSMPSRALVYRWRRAPDCLLEGKTFGERYTEAEADRTLTWEDEVVEIPEVELAGDRTDIARVSRARLKFDTLKYVMAKSNPDRYGTRKIEDGQHGTVRIQIVNYSESFPEKKQIATDRVVWEPKSPLLETGIVDQEVLLRQENDDAER